MQSGFQTLHQKTLIKIIVVLSLYGFTVEILQETLTLDRHFELLDELANATGSVIGAWAGKKLFSAPKEL
jgi:hypothetical protein